MSNAPFIVTRALPGFLLTVASASGPVVAGEIDTVAVEAAWSLYNPDWEERRNASGVSLLVRTDFAGRYFAVASVNLLETDPVDLPVTDARGLPFRNWHRVGIGYGWSPNDRIRLEAIMTYQGVEVVDDWERGGGLAVSVGGAVAERIDWRVETGWLHVAISDWTIGGQVSVALTPSLAATARLVDYANWDFTRYELGLEWRF